MKPNPPPLPREVMDLIFSFIKPEDELKVFRSVMYCSKDWYEEYSGRLYKKAVITAENCKEVMYGLKWSLERSEESPAKRSHARKVALLNKIETLVIVDLPAASSVVEALGVSKRAAWDESQLYRVSHLFRLNLEKARHGKPIFSKVESLSLGKDVMNAILETQRTLLETQRTLLDLALRSGFSPKHLCLEWPWSNYRPLLNLFSSYRWFIPNQHPDETHRRYVNRLAQDWQLESLTWHSLHADRYKPMRWDNIKHIRVFHQQDTIQGPPSKWTTDVVFQHVRHILYQNKSDNENHKFEIYLDVEPRRPITTEDLVQYCIGLDPRIGQMSEILETMKQIDLTVMHYDEALPCHCCGKR
nr:uncharacterized protein CI109_003842 [Kwoniella shandongensis]KAA5527870.1 hypothetical protein CI109_003842 [Kwoniella shandongensis]